LSHLIHRHLLSSLATFLAPLRPMAQHTKRTPKEFV
jgi:hypothetical protein